MGQGKAALLHGKVAVQARSKLIVSHLGRLDGDFVTTAAVIRNSTSRRSIPSSVPSTRFFKQDLKQCLSQRIRISFLASLVSSYVWSQNVVHFALDTSRLFNTTSTTTTVMIIIIIICPHCVHKLAEPKINHHGFPFVGQHDIFRFDVAVDEADAVQELSRVENLARQSQSALVGQGDSCQHRWYNHIITCDSQVT